MTTPLTAVTAAIVAAVMFVSISGVHAYWAMGGLWPGTDSDSLYRMVVGGAPRRSSRGRSSPGRTATWIVAARA